MQTDKIKPAGLGKGLGALLGPSQSSTQAFHAVTQRVPSRESETPSVSLETSSEEGSQVLRTLSIQALHANVEQPRTVFHEDALDDLAESIREHGILQPLVAIETTEGHYELLAGERRLRAAKKAGLTQVPVLVRKALPLRDKLILALIENIQRENLHGSEEARAYDRLVHEYGLSHEEIARRVGKSRSLVSNTLRLLELDSDMLSALEEGRITKSHARTLLAEPVPTLRRTLFAKMLQGEGMSVREAEIRTTRRLHGERTKGIKDPNVLALERNLREKLGTKVALEHRGGGGRVVISYYSKEDLRRLVGEILGKDVEISGGDDEGMYHEEEKE